MTKDELQLRLRELRVQLVALLDSTERWHNSPAWDEDYKVEREPRFTEQAFRELYEAVLHANELADRLP